MGDGSWDKSSNRLVLNTNNFTLDEVNLLQLLLLSKLNISYYTVKLIIRI